MILPSAVMRVRRQSEQNGSVTEAMIPTVPSTGPVASAVPGTRARTSKRSAGAPSRSRGSALST